MPEFRYQTMFPHGADATSYRKLDGTWVGIDTFRGERVLTVDAAAPATWHSCARSSQTRKRR